MRLTAQTLSRVTDSTCKQDDYHLYYKVCTSPNDTFYFTDYKYVYTYTKKVKSVNKVFEFDKTRFHIIANTDSIWGSCTSDMGTPSFKFILKLKDVCYIILVEDYTIIKVTTLFYLKPNEN